MIEQYFQIPLNQEFAQLAEKEHSLKGAPLNELQSYFTQLYGRRNSVYLPDRLSRINFLNIAITDIKDAVRKDASDSHMQHMVARTLSRTFCVANGINDLPLSQGMMEKFPLAQCAYCGFFPCQCTERRADPVHTSAISYEQEQWSIRDWQDHLNAMYGENNNKKGIVTITDRLSSEVSELMSLEYSILRDRLPMNEVEREYRQELADVTAWNIALANFYGIDIEESILERYGNGCMKCLQNPCICGPHNFKQIRPE